MPKRAANNLVQFPGGVSQKEMMDALLRQLVLEKATEDLKNLMDRVRVASAKGLLQPGELVYCQCRNRIINKRLCEHYKDTR